MKEIRLKARAKINLGLDVLGKREDGYHEVRMIMQTVPLYDRLELKVVEEPGIRVRTNLSYLPSNGDNLVYRAAELLMEEFGISKGLSVELGKRIPVSAGLAGGSSDAAAALVGVNRLFGLQLTKRELMERAVRIGADVPFCVMRGTALAEGIGEKLTPLPALPPCFLVIAKPKVSVSTKMVYGKLEVDRLPFHPDIDGQIRALRQRDLPALAEKMGNVLETVVLPAYPAIGRIRQTMQEQGALNAMMSGSGPTVFGLFAERAAAEKCYEVLKVCPDVRNLFLNEIGEHRN